MLEQSNMDIPSCWNSQAWTSLHAGTVQPGHPFMLEQSGLDIPSYGNIQNWDSLHAGTPCAGHLLYWAFLHAGTSHSCSRRVTQLYAIYPDTGYKMTTFAAFLVSPKWNHF